MGVFFCENNLPYFSPDGKNKFEIKTSQNPGAKIRVESNPSSLEPNTYYEFGVVSSEIRILKLDTYKNCLDPYLEEYAGDFTIAEGGKVVFPSVIRWTKQPEFNEVGTTYQFHIRNGIGTFNEVK